MNEGDYKKSVWTPSGVIYNEKTIEERLSHELKDLADWLEPTPFEEFLRYQTMTRYIRLIENCFEGSYVSPQGSSVTKTYIPSSDIDLIVINAGVTNIRRFLGRLVKELWKYDMIIKAVVIPFARVPVAKVVDKAFRFNIDICVNNVNGCLNIPRVLKLMEELPHIRPTLFFFKAFTFINDIDDPADGGFGSNQLLNFCLFGSQFVSDAKNSGDMLIKLLDIFGNKLNYFFCCISTVGKGYLLSKARIKKISKFCPLSFVNEDPQMPGFFCGEKSTKLPAFRYFCSEARDHILESTKKNVSPLFYVLDNISEIEETREMFSRIEKHIYRDGISLSSYIYSTFRPKHFGTSPSKPQAEAASKNSKPNPFLKYDKANEKRNRALKSTFKKSRSEGIISRYIPKRR